VDGHAVAGRRSLSGLGLERCDELECPGHEAVPADRPAAALDRDRQEDRRHAQGPPSRRQLHQGDVARLSARGQSPRNGRRSCSFPAATSTTASGRATYRRPTGGTPR
jgi:hypothetical protein